MTNLEQKVSRRSFLKGLGLAGGFLALSGPLSFRVFAQPPVVKVGTLFDYTGALAEFGPPFRNAADLAAGQINAAAEEVLGGPIIELVHEDSGTTASIGIDRAKKLIEVDGVPAIVGSLASGVTVPVAESVTIPAKVLQISPASTSPLITVLPADVGQDYLFRTTASDAFQGVVAAQLARGEILVDYKFETAATIYVNNPYGQGLSNVFARSFQLRGGIITAQVPHPEEVQPTYSSQLALALKEKPDVLLAISYPGHATIFLAESRDVFDYTSWQFVDGTKSEEIIAALGPEVLEGKLGTAPGADPEREGFKKFSAAYEEAYGEKPPLPFMDSTYDAVAVIALSIAKAVADGVDISGTTLRDALRPVSNPPGEIVGVAEFKKAFELLKGSGDTDYSGAAGEQNFDEVGDVVTAQEIWQYTEGTIKTVTIRKPEEIPEE
jgi:ABC-type branched-subunit amino acid transport system substrate-binding protein